MYPALTKGHSLILARAKQVPLLLSVESWCGYIHWQCYFGTFQFFLLCFWCFFPFPGKPSEAGSSLDWFSFFSSLAPLFIQITGLQMKDFVVHPICFGSSQNLLFDDALHVVLCWSSLSTSSTCRTYLNILNLSTSETFRQKSATNPTVHVRNKEWIKLSANGEILPTS